MTSGFKKYAEMVATLARNSCLHCAVSPVAGIVIESRNARLRESVGLEETRRKREKSHRFVEAETSTIANTNIAGLASFLILKALHYK